MMIKRNILKKKPNPVVLQVSYLLLFSTMGGCRTHTLQILANVQYCSRLMRVDDHYWYSILETVSWLSSQMISVLQTLIHLLLFIRANVVTIFVFATQQSRSPHPIMRRYKDQLLLTLVLLLCSNFINFSVSTIRSLLSLLLWYRNLFTFFNIFILTFKQVKSPKQ